MLERIDYAVRRAADFSVTMASAVTAIVTRLCRIPGKSGGGDARKASDRAKTRKARISQKPLGQAPLWVLLRCPSGILEAFGTEAHARYFAHAGFFCGCPGGGGLDEGCCGVALGVGIGERAPVVTKLCQECAARSFRHGLSQVRMSPVRASPSGTPGRGYARPSGRVSRNATPADAWRAYASRLKSGTPPRVRGTGRRSWSLLSSSSALPCPPMSSAPIWNRAATTRSPGSSGTGAAKPVPKIWGSTPFAPS